MGHRQHPTMNISHVVYVCNRSLYLVIALVSYGKWAAGGKRRGARSPRQRAERRHTDADGSGWYLRGACARARDVEAWARPSRAAYPYARRCFVLRRFGSGGSAPKSEANALGGKECHVYRYAVKDTGGSRDAHVTRDTYTGHRHGRTGITQTNLTTIQTQRHSRTTSRRPKPHTGKKTPGEPGHTRDTQAHTRTHGGHRRTSQASKPNDTPVRPRDSPKPETAADSQPQEHVYCTGTGTSADLAPRLWDPLSPVACSCRLLLFLPHFVRAPP